MKRGIALALLLAASSARADDLKTFGRDYWVWRTLHQPMSSDDVPRIARPHGWQPDYSAAAVSAMRKDLAAFEDRFRALADPKAPVPEQIDYRLMGSALARVHWELDGVRSWRRDPGFYVAQTLGSVVDLLVMRGEFTPEKSRDVVTRLAAFPKILSDAQANLDELVAPFSALAVSDLADIGPRLRKAMAALRPLVVPEARNDLDAKTEKAVGALESYRAWLLSKQGSDRLAIGRDAYISFLRNVALMPFTPEQLLAMGRQEWARAVAGESLERTRNEGLPELPIFKDQQAQIDRATRDELAVRQFLEARGILTVPSWMRHYGYHPIPAYLEPIAEFGEGTDFTSPEHQAESSSRYIPKPSPNLGYFALSMARDPRADMVHEGIPGHGFQLALSWHQDDEIRRHWYDSGINEGLGFYCEEMMFEMGLFDDSPKSREMIWSYARLRALRVEVDVRIALGTFTIDEAAHYLAAAVPMDEATARSEAASFAAAPGFAIGYQTGKLQIVKLLAEARERQGASFSLRKFHDFVFANGNVPISLQRWELLGLRDEVE